MHISLSKKRIWITGASGLVGTSLRAFLKNYDCELLTPSHSELDLTRQKDVEAWVKDNQPQIVFALAALVGGIEANRTKPCDFLYENTMIAMNTIHACANSESVEKLLYLGPACAYPKDAPMPLKEDSLLAGALEPTNEAYAIAKITGIKLCHYYNTQHNKNFITAISANTFGPNDGHKLEDMHVISALFTKFRHDKEQKLNTVTLWGSGKPLREFIYVDDLANTLIFLMENYNESTHINIGTGAEISIYDLAHKIKGLVGFSGEIEWDKSKPDGMMRKVLDSSNLPKNIFYLNCKE